MKNEACVGEEAIEIGDCTCNGQNNHPDGCICKDSADEECFCGGGDDPLTCLCMDGSYQDCVCPEEEYEHECLSAQYSALRVCIGGDGGSVDPNTCRCVTGAVPTNCECPPSPGGALLEGIPVDPCTCDGDNDPRRGITCAVETNCATEARDPLCLCASG